MCGANDERRTTNGRIKMLWAIKHDGLGCLIGFCEEDGYTHIVDGMPILFDTYRDACLWIVANVDNNDDAYRVIAWLP